MTWTDGVLGTMSWHDALLVIIACGVWSIALKLAWVVRYLAALDANLADLQDDLRERART